jgi:hypothetical protein
VKLYAIALGILLTVAFVLAMTTKHVEYIADHRHVSYPAGGAWWLILGVLIGLLAGVNLHWLAVRPWKWQVRIGSENYQGMVPVSLRRWGSTVTIGEANPKSDRFDEALHELVAEARQKAAALEVASR